MNREYHKWYSPVLQRDMELLVFGHNGRAVLFFPTRMARFYDYENWHVLNSLHSQIYNGEIQLFCVDSIDNESFYNRHVYPEVRMARHVQYEEYILNEVLPLMRIKNNSGYFEAAGCSMGAYHAINIALKHPCIFKKAVGMSGRYDLTQQIADFRDLFDGYHNEEIYFNMPRQYVANLNDGDQLNTIRKLEIILAIGETDPFWQSNHDFSELLWGKGIANRFYTWGNYAHRPRHWRQMVQLYL
ncbi:MAG: esterase family protein [Sphingobacteriales bacterium]